MAVIGAKEVETSNLSVRTRADGDVGSLPKDQVLNVLKRAVADYSDWRSAFEQENL